ncbi:MAG: histidinol-phosphatase [Anaerotardibacter sp.]
MAYSAFHNHTTYCDGKNTPEEMVLEAIKLGMPSLGFSGHSYTFFDESYCMSKEATRAYLAELARLKERYADQITIFIGIEQDMYSTEPTAPYDFVIGAKHYLYKDGIYLDVDDCPEVITRDCQTHFGGDFYAYAEAYYEQASHIIDKTQCTFIAHFDLVTKFNEGNALFDESNPRYQKAALKAVDTLCEQGAVFEINTGAMIKGYRTTPYPAPFILDRIAQHGNRVILSTDSHSIDTLQFGLKKAEELAKTHGLSVIKEL